MGFGRGLLDDDEELLAEVRPHPILVVGPLLLLAVAIAAAVAIALRYPSAPVEVAWLLAAMVVLPALWAFGRVLRWRAVQFLVTPTRLLYRRGLFRRDVVQLRLQRVAEVQSSQSLFGRVIGCGRLVFEVVGGYGPLVVENVRRPRSLQRLVSAQLDRLDVPPARNETTRAAARQGGLGAWDEPSPPVAVPSRRSRAQKQWSDTPPHGVALREADGGLGNVPVQILQLDELRRRGILSDSEFAAKKAELLGRL